MKFIRFLIPFPVIAVFFMISGASFSSCTKTRTDTIYITRDSSVYVRDTTVLTDTLYDLTSGLVAWYSFNGGSLNDSSGYQNNITFNNATPTTDRYGRPNNAYLFNGSSSYMEVPNSPSLNPDNITMYAIIKINGFYTGTYHLNQVFVKGYNYADGQYALNFCDTPRTPGTNVDTSLEYVDGNYGDNAAQNNTDISIGYRSASHVSAGNWYKVAFTFDGLIGKLYLNGVLVGTRSSTTSFTPNTTNLQIGTNMDPSTLYPYWFNGVIDEIRIYNRALPAQAIVQLSNLTD